MASSSEVSVSSSAGAASSSKQAKNITFGYITDKNIEQLKLLMSVILPVQYSDKFYQDILKNGEDFTKLAYDNDILVGAASCRLEPAKDKDTPARLYIMTFGVLAPYRRRGIGNKLFEEIMGMASRNRAVEQIVLHVQINNDEALAFYQKHGFEIVSKIENYYRRIDPPHCYLLVKYVN